jgi:hypothetical protein
MELSTTSGASMLIEPPLPLPLPLVAIDVMEVVALTVRVPDPDVPAVREIKPPFASSTVPIAAPACTFRLAGSKVRLDAAVAVITPPLPPSPIPLATKATIVLGMVIFPAGADKAIIPPGPDEPTGEAKMSTSPEVDGFPKVKSPWGAAMYTAAFCPPPVASIVPIPAINRAENILSPVVPVIVIAPFGAVELTMPSCCKLEVVMATEMFLTGVTNG